MMMNSISTSTNYNFSNYNISGISTSKNNVSNKPEEGRTNGPRPSRGGGDRGPKIDSNNDEAWNIEELEKFSTDTNNSIDSKKVMAAYDTNNDGSIDSSEREALKKDNALNLPSPKDIQNRMSQNPSGQQMKLQGGKGGPPSQGVSGIDTDDSDSWELEELEALAESLSESSETSFDSAEIIAKYDVNNNGSIDASERAAIQEDNAFNLTASEELDQQNNQENIQQFDIVAKALNAYSVQSTYSEFNSQSQFNSLAI